MKSQKRFRLVTLFHWHFAMIPFDAVFFVRTIFTLVTSINTFRYINSMYLVRRKTSSWSRYFWLVLWYLWFRRNLRSGFLRYPQSAYVQYASIVCLETRSNIYGQGRRVGKKSKKHKCYKRCEWESDCCCQWYTLIWKENMTKMQDLAGTDMIPDKVILSGRLFSRRLCIYIYLI